MRTPKRSIAAAGLLACLLAGVLAGCAGAEAEPLEVTYYYLPG